MGRYPAEAGESPGEGSGIQTACVYSRLEYTRLQLPRTKHVSIRRQRRSLRILRTTKISTMIVSSKNTGSNILVLHSESKKWLTELREAANVMRYGSVTPRGIRG
ncbi:hypothetical protein Bca4012_024228 [Brassica carinata]